MREDVLACAVDFPELLVNTPARSLVFVIHSSRRSWALFWVMKWLELMTEIKKNEQPPSPKLFHPRLLVTLGR